jgi:hypothetical protein
MQQEEPQYSVLVFSKYSDNCKKLIQLISSSGVNFSNLQSLCIDNDKVRQRILQNEIFNITVVPSILSIYNNGNVEAYEGANAFNWVQEIITRFSPPPQPQPQPPPINFQPPPQHESQNQRTTNSKPQEHLYLPNNDNQRISTRGRHKNDPEGLGEDPEEPLENLSPKEIASLQRVISDRGESVGNPQRKQELSRQTRGQGETKVKIRPKIEQREETEPRNIPRRMKPIETSSTSIDDLPYEEAEESDDNDRHRTVRQPRRIRQDEGNYEEDENLFSGEMLDNRKEPGNTVKNKAQKSTKETGNIKSKADALALEREASEKQINRPDMRSDSEFRRP